MKQIIQAIFASLLLLVVGISFCACDGEDWHADTETILTDADHGSLTNGRVVATGIVKNVTHNSATILCSANYNYKESLKITPYIIYSNQNKNKYGYERLDKDCEYATVVKINNFTSSACEVTLTNLKPNTTYYYRAYAPNDIYTDHYGDIKSFRTSMDNSVGDAVDLGLSVKWASKNIGASQLEEEGEKFYWGAIDACETNYHADWHDYSITTLVARGYLEAGSGDQPATGTEITCAQAAKLAMALEDNTESAETYTVTGYITETDGKMSRNQQIFWMADTKDGGKVFEGYWANLPKPYTALPVGTKLKMTGKLKRYGSTPEMHNGNIVILDGNNNLSPSYDAATRIWGSKWRMPTERECRELITQCTWKSTTKNGEKVYLVTGPNGNVIYLPSDYTYWTSTANQYDSYYLECYSSYYGWRTMTTTSRDVLKSIRPVMDK